MRQFIARIFCLLTILFLSSNAVFSAVYAFDHNSKNQEAEKLIFKFIKFEDDETNEAKLGFFAENDDVEEFEFLSELPAAILNFLSLVNSSESALSDKNFYLDFSEPNVPRWLWVKHILI